MRYPGFRDGLRAIGEAANGDFETDCWFVISTIEALWEAREKDLLDPVPMLHRQLSDRRTRVQLTAAR